METSRSRRCAAKQTDVNAAGVAVDQRWPSPEPEAQFKEQTAAHVQRLALASADASWVSTSRTSRGSPSTRTRSVELPAGLNSAWT